MEKITRKKFVEVLCSGQSILVGSTFRKHTVEEVQELIDRYDAEFDFSNGWREVIKVQTKSLCFGHKNDDPHNDGSWLSWDQQGFKYEYYHHKDNYLVQYAHRAACKGKYGEVMDECFNVVIYYMIPLQKVAFKLDISASSGSNPESAG